jgi:hypothetical protein
MTVTEPTESTRPSLIKDAFRHIGNRSPAAPCCVCGHCLAGGNYSDIELGLDACVTQSWIWWRDRITHVQSPGERLVVPARAARTG